MHTLYIVGSLIGAVVMLAWRMREGKQPVSLRKIVMPPLGMSTGFGMFFYPPTRVPLAWAVGALLLGATVFAYPLLKTSKLTVSGRNIMVERSSAFLWILVGLVAVRFGLRSYLEEVLPALQTGALFYLLAFGMIVRWRIAMLREFQGLQRQLNPPETAAEVVRA